MTLKITSPEKQTAVLNRWADSIELDIKKNTHLANTALSRAQQAITTSSSPVLFTSIKTIVSNYTITKTDQVLLVNSPGPTTITLAAVISQAGQVWRVKNINTGVITVKAATGSVDNFPSVTLDLTRQSFDIVFDGANWWIL